VTHSKLSGLRRKATSIGFTILATTLVSTVALSATSMNVLYGSNHVAGTHVPKAVMMAQAPFAAKLETGRTLQLGVHLPVRNQPELDGMLQDIYNPQSPNFHHYLSVEEYTNRFGPTQQDYDAVVQWARDNGFKIVETPSNRRMVSIKGSVGTINRAMHVSMSTFAHPTEDRTFFAPDREPTVDLSVPLLQITGLDNYTPPTSHLHRRFGPMLGGGVAHATGSGPSGEYLPSDMRAAYYGSGSLTGAGQSIGIFSYDGYKTADVTLFYSSTGMSSSVPIHNVLVGGYSGVCDAGDGTGTSTCDDGEQILDIVNAIGMAPGISQVQFYEGTSATAILNKMATDNTSKVLSCSWGGGDFGSAADDPIFQEFAAQGQSFLNATGDDGAYNSQTWLPPSEDPYITQVGGTDLTTNGAGGSWASETGWPDSGGGFYSTSGDHIPSYQQLAGVINTSNKGSTTWRNDPDVAMEANFDNPTTSNGQFLTGYGGTSFAAPRWAGFIALVNQQSVANGHGTVGFVNPALYNLGTGSTAGSMFHDITSGNNRPTAGTGTGFNAVAGYDLVTGWGSPQGANIINALAGGATTTPDFSLSASPSSVTLTQGTNGTSTVTVNKLNGFTASVNLVATGLPSGVTASFNPASTTSTSVLTLTASATAATGNATVTVTGTSGSLSHSASIGLTVNPTGGGGGSTQLLGNTGFETGAATPWTISSGVLCSNSTCSGETAHAGTFFAWLDGYGSAHTDTVSQQVAITAGKTTATLSYYLHIDTKETTTATAYDKLTVGLYSTGGALLKTLATYSNLNKNTGYTVHTNDVSAYIGQTVVVKFTGTEDSSLATSFVLDDVTLTVQ
jgi:subtilase family serine protease